MAGAFTYILAGMLALLLLAAAWGDIRSRTIANGLNAAIALMAPLWWWANGLALWPDIGMQIGIACLVFAIFAAAFAANLMGGGDVKLIGALALWIPLQPLLTMLVLMALAGGVVTLIALVIHRMRRLSGGPEVPYGVAIVFAGLWVIANDLLTNLGS